MITHNIIDRCGEVRIAKVVTKGCTEYAVESFIAAKAAFSYQLHARYPTLGEARVFFSKRTGKIIKPKE